MATKSEKKAEALELRGRKKYITEQMAKLAAKLKTREATAEDENQTRDWEAEIDAIDARVAKLEAEVFDEEDDDTEREENDHDDDAPEDEQREARIRRRKRERRAERRAGKGADTERRREREVRRERSATSGGRYTEGDVLILPNGQRAVVEREGGFRRDTTDGRRRARQEERAPRRTNYLDEHTRRRSLEPYRQAFMNYVENGNFRQRAIQQDNDVAGGYLVAPVQIYERVLKIIDNMLFINQLATKITVSGAQSLGVPTLETDPEDADWTGEITTIDEDSAMAFGRRELRPNVVTKLIKMSKKWLRNAKASGWQTASGDTAENISGPEDMVSKRLAYKFGVTREKAYMTGSGTGKPLGLFTASTRGISSSRDVVSGSATNLTYAGLINVVMNQRQGYDNQWLVSRNFVKLARQLVDSQNRPLFLDPMTFGKPETLLGHPYMMSEYCPSTFTSGQYVGIFGDFSYFLIANGETLGVQNLMELFALTNQIGLIGYEEIDAMPGMEDAFTRVITN